jgi:two-component system response regulator MtrA
MCLCVSPRRRVAGQESTIETKMSMEKPRILIVDDDHMLTDMWRMLLADRFTVGVENSGAAALETAQQFRPDLIFLDVCLPDKNGSDIAAELATDPALKSTPVVFMTGLVSRAEAVEKRMFGRYIVLSKPFKTHELIACAGRFLHDPLLAA